MSDITGAIYTNDPKSNYIFTKPGSDIVRTPDTVNTIRVDYTVPRTQEDIDKGHDRDLPLSFFEIKDGDIEAGRLWYQQKYPKLTDEFAYLLARYNWGDLKYATKKSIRNNAKKVRKKSKHKPDFDGGFKKTCEPVTIVFD